MVPELLSMTGVPGERQLFSIWQIISPIHRGCLVYGQPLYIENLSIPLKGFHNVVYVATENDTVYAFDADGRNSSYLWKRNLTNPAAGVTAVPCADLGVCNNLASMIGIRPRDVMSRIIT